MHSQLNHVALLVEDVERIVARDLFDSQLVGEIEHFPSEGTLEVYIGEPQSLGKLLLLQPKGKGPYRRAFEKRGPGLHHIGIEVTNLDQFINQIGGSGWYIHPSSLSLFQPCRQVFLVRPGVHFLVEVQELRDSVEGSCFIQKVDLKIEREDLIKSLCCENLSQGIENSVYIFDSKFNINDLCS